VSKNLAEGAEGKAQRTGTRRAWTRPLVILQQGGEASAKTGLVETINSLGITEGPS